MRIISMAIVLTFFLALFSTQVFAQGKSPPSGDDGKAAKAAAEKHKRHADEEAAAKAASSKIPDSKEKYDPWKIAR